MFKKYKELERNLLTAKMDIELALAKRKKLVDLCGPQDVQAQQYDIPRVKGLKSKDANDVYVELLRVQNEINVLSNYIKRLETIKTNILIMFEKFAAKHNDLETEVFIRHHVKRQSLLEISEELNYTYQWIRKVNMNITRKIKESTYNQHTNILSV